MDLIKENLWIREQFNVFENANTNATTTFNGAIGWLSVVLIIGIFFLAQNIISSKIVYTKKIEIENETFDVDYKRQKIIGLVIASVFLISIILAFGLGYHFIKSYLTKVHETYHDSILKLNKYDLTPLMNQYKEILSRNNANELKEFVGHDFSWLVNKTSFKPELFEVVNLNELSFIRIIAQDLNLNPNIIIVLGSISLIVWLSNLVFMIIYNVRSFLEYESKIKEIESQKLTQKR